MIFEVLFLQNDLSPFKVQQDFHSPLLTINFWLMLRPSFFHNHQHARYSGIEGKKLLLVSLHRHLMIMVGVFLAPSQQCHRHIYARNVA